MVLSASVASDRRGNRESKGFRSGVLSKDKKHYKKYKEFAIWYPSLDGLSEGSNEESVSSSSSKSLDRKEGT